MIECYLDESGVHEEAPICVIAGFFGGQGQWRKFSAQWRRIMNSAGIPLEEFHAKDFVKSKSRQSTLDALAQVVNASPKIHPVSVGVAVRDFKSLPQEQRRFLTGARIDKGQFISTGSPNKPYFLPFILCVERVAGYASMGGKVHFFCGLDRQFADYATDLFNSVKADVRLGDIQFPLAKETPQLQAADLLVHLTYLDMQKRILDGGEDRPLGSLLSKCMRNALAPKDDFVYFDRRAMDLTFKPVNGAASNSMVT
jgi:hypothetical protein